MIQTLNLYAELAGCQELALNWDRTSVLPEFARQLPQNANVFDFRNAVAWGSITAFWCIIKKVRGVCVCGGYVCGCGESH